jgi:hypothetical protein
MASGGNDREPLVPGDIFLTPTRAVDGCNRDTPLNLMSLGCVPFRRAEVAGCYSPRTTRVSPDISGSPVGIAMPMGQPHSGVVGFCHSCTGSA